MDGETEDDTAALTPKEAESPSQINRDTMPEDGIKTDTTTSRRWTLEERK